MTNAELKRIAKMIDGHLEKVRELVSRIEESERDDKDDIIGGFDSNNIPIFASAVDIIESYRAKD
jgi:hypothetical protein